MSSHEVLTGVVQAMPGVGVAVVGADGAIKSQIGVADDLRWVATHSGRRLLAPAGRRVVCVRLGTGDEVVGTFAQGDGGPQAQLQEQLLESALRLFAKCEQLEQDMESMNHSSLQLLEQVAMLGETLPKLSAAESEAEIARTGLLACVVATGVERALYLRVDQHTGFAEVLVHVQIDRDGRATVRPYPLSDRVPATSGILAEVLAGGESVVLRAVGSLGSIDADAPESLARREVLGASVTCDDGDQRQALGAILLCDKAHAGYGAVEARLGSEERQVALSFASMLGAVIGARQSAELGKELSMAQTIQTQILPAGPARVPGFDLAGDYRTSGEVGGDYFDFVQLADGRTLAVVADVSGHNLASGMVMVSARATLRTLAAVRSDPAQLFEDLASGLFQDLLRTERFITAAGVALRPHDALVDVVNAGHNDLLLYRAADGSVARLRAESTVFGFMPRATYDGTGIRLEAGDCLLLYTDGVTEATDGTDEMFGEERLEQVLAGAARGSARQIVAAVLARVQEFRGPGRRGDDVTVLAIKRTPTAAGSQA